LILLHSINGCPRLSVSKHLEENQFTLIANDIRNMKRLWENKGLGGLIKRREFEALMFEKYGECTCYQN